MHHVNKRFSENGKLFCIICFLFFMFIILAIKINSYDNNESEKQIEHETEVQSDTKTIEEIEDFKKTIYTIKLGTDVKFQSTLTKQLIIKTKEIIQGKAEQETEADRIETSKVSTFEPQENQKLVRENKLYYIQDNGYRFDLSEKYQDYLWQLCKEYKVTDYYELFIAQMYHESNFNESVISKTNDYGLMQINKCNHKWLSEELGNGDFLDPYNNMEAGVLIMSRFLQKYSDVHKSLVCYNGGESIVINGTYSTSYSKCVISDMDKLIEIK